MIADELEPTFNWTAPSRKAQEMSLYVATSTPAFTAEVMKSGVKVRSMYASPLPLASISGIAMSLTVQKEDLVKKGIVKAIPLTAKVKAGLKDFARFHDLCFRGPPPGQC